MPMIFRSDEIDGGLILPFLKGALRRCVGGGIYSPFPKGSGRRPRDFMKLHYNPHLKVSAQILRRAENVAEVLLWKEIRAKKLGVQFLRQRPIGSYIIDFYCHKLNLAIEIDGISHDSKIEADIARQKNLEADGVRFLRFYDKDIRHNLDAVLKEIQEKILRLKTEAPPLKKRQ